MAREHHLVPRRVVVHRPISEMNKQITGSGFISLLSSLVCLLLGLPKLENGSLPSNPQPLSSEGFWCWLGNTDTYSSSTINQVLEDLFWTGHLRKRPYSLIPSGISFPKHLYWEPTLYLHPYFRNGETGSVGNRSEPGSHSPLRQNFNLNYSDQHCNGQEQGLRLAIPWCQAPNPHHFAPTWQLPRWAPQAPGLTTLLFMI